MSNPGRALCAELSAVVAAPGGIGSHCSECVGGVNTQFNVELRSRARNDVSNGARHEFVLDHARE
jgi:hypothetical protein